MAVKAIVTKVIGAVPDENDNLDLTWEVFYVGPEINTWSQGASRIWRTECHVTFDGLASLVTLGRAVTACAVDGLANSTGISMLATDVYMPDYMKGLV